LYIWYTDADTSQWVQINLSGGAGALTAESRNRIVNGAMQISQENGNTTGSYNPFHAADQWFLFYASTGTFTAQRVQSVTPNGSKDRFRITITVADAALAAGDYLCFQQKIEGSRVADFRYGSASAKQSVLRFGFKGPAGTYAAALQNGGFNRSYIAPFTISAGQANTDTEQVFIIPGDITGTWATDTAVGIAVFITLAAGSAVQGAAGWSAANAFATSAISNGMATAGNVFELFDVGLYLDRNNTGLPPPWVMPDEAQEKIACRRYFIYETALGNLWCHPIDLASGYRRAIYHLNPEMRIAPAGTVTGTASGSAFGATLPAIASPSPYMVEINGDLVGAGFSSMNTIKLNARM
jgi:hypothetical protein